MVGYVSNIRTGARSSSPTAPGRDNSPLTTGNVRVLTLWTESASWASTSTWCGDEPLPSGLGRTSPTLSALLLTQKLQDGVAGRLSSLRRQTKQGFCGSGSTPKPATYFVSAPSPQVRSRNTSTSLSASSSTTSCSPGMDRYSPPRNTNRYSANDVTSANRSSWNGLPKPSHRHRLPLGHRWTSVPPGCHSSTPKPGRSTHPDIGRCWHAAHAGPKAGFHRGARSTMPGRHLSGTGPRQSSTPNSTTRRSVNSNSSSTPGTP